MSEQDQTRSSTSSAGPSQEGNLAMWAHLAGGILDLLCVLTFVAWVPALIIYLTNKDKSKFVAFHGLQALILQLAVAVINFLLWIPGMIGLFFITVPLAMLVNIGAFVYALLIGLKAKDGHWAEYAIIGDFARGQTGGPDDGTAT